MVVPPGVVGAVVVPPAPVVVPAAPLVAAPLRIAAPDVAAAMLPVAALIAAEVPAPLIVVNPFLDVHFHTVGSCTLQPISAYKSMNIIALISIIETMINLPIHTRPRELLAHIHHRQLGIITPSSIAVVPNHRVDIVAGSPVAPAATPAARPAEAPPPAA